MNRADHFREWHSSLDHCNEQIQDGNGTASENEIRGGLIGIGVVAEAVNTVGMLRDNEIKGTSVAPVREIACCGFTAKAIIEKE